MSGRGRGYRGRSSRGGGRGRGKPKSSSQTSNAAKPVVRKTLADHVYAIGSARQASDYSVITAFIINHIRKTFEYGDDIGDALESRSETVLQPPSYSQQTRPCLMRLKHWKRSRMRFSTELRSPHTWPERTNTKPIKAKLSH